MIAVPIVVIVLFQFNDLGLFIRYFQIVFLDCPHFRVIEPDAFIDSLSFMYSIRTASLLSFKWEKF